MQEQFLGNNEGLDKDQPDPLLSHFAEQQKLTQHCKATILQLKKKKRGPFSHHTKMLKKKKINWPQPNVHTLEIFCTKNCSTCETLTGSLVSSGQYILPF